MRVMLLLFSEISFQLLDHQVKLDISLSTTRVSSVAVDFWSGLMVVYKIRL